MAGSAKTRETVTPSVGMDSRPKRSDTRGSAATRKIIMGVTNTDDVVLLNLEEKLRQDLIEDLRLPEAPKPR